MNNGQPLNERMSNRKASVLLRVNTHAEIVGESLGSVTPLVAQATSAITVGYATFEGVGRYTSANDYIAVAAGIIAAIAIEGIGYISVSERDKAMAHNRRTEDKSQHIDTDRADNYVTQSFWAAMALVAGFETVPAIYRAFVGTGDAMSVLFGLCLLLFPILSRLGAQLLAFRMVRESVDTSADDLAVRQLKAKFEREEIEARHRIKLEKIESRGDTFTKVSQPKGDTFMKVSRKRSTTGESVGESENNTFTEEHESFHESIGESIPLGKRIVYYLIENPQAKLSDIAAALSVSEPTVSRALAPLIESGVLHSEKVGRRNILTVNGEHEKYLAG